MVNHITYEAGSQLKTVELNGENHLYAETIPELRSGEWTYKQKGKFLSARSRSSRTVNLALKATRASILEEFLELADKDVESNTPGVLHVNDWQAQVFIVKDAAQTITPQFYETTLTLLLVEGVWRRPSNHEYVIDIMQGEGLDYAHDYNFDYTRNNIIGRLNNQGSQPPGLDLTIFGPVSNPRITIAGNSYAVDATIASGERIEVKSLEKTVTLVRADGERENILQQAYFNKGMDIFAPLPLSGGEVAWNNNFNFDITVWEQKGRAPWL